MGRGELKARGLAFNRESELWWMTSSDLYLSIILAAVWRMVHQGAKMEAGSD